MSLNLKSIVKRGVLEDERAIIEVLANCNVAKFIAVKTKRLASGNFSGRFKTNYWFASKPVLKGDLVVLYSKVGLNSESKNDDGSTTHFFYWNQAEPMWVSSEDGIGLIEIMRWNFKALTQVSDQE